MKFFIFHIGDWSTATSDLSPMEELLYFKILLKYYSQGCALERTQCERIANALRLQSDDELNYVLSTFFYSGEDGLLHNERADEEIAKAAEKSEKARKSALSRVLKTKTQNNDSSERTANDERTMSERTSNDVLTINHKPLTNIDITNSETQEEAPITKPAPRRKSSTCTVSKPEEVDDQLWSDWVSHRKAKNATISKTVIDGLRKWESAGYSLPDVMRIQIENGWQGFKPEWVESKTKSNGSSREMTQEERIACNYDCSNIWPDWNERYPNAK